MSKRVQTASRREGGRDGGGGELLTKSAALLPLGEVLKAVGGTALGLLVLLDVPRQLGGDVGDETAAGPQAVVVAPHPELAVLREGKVEGGVRLSQSMCLLLLLLPVCY